MTDPGDDDRSDPIGWLRWFWRTDRGAVVYVRDVVTSVFAVLLIGAVLFGISGIWPPMVAVESGSMEPNMERGDLVFVVDNQRFTPAAAPVHAGESTGVVPADVAIEHHRTKFGQHGDVIVFRPDGDTTTTPIIHRAMLWVEEDEDWYDRAAPGAVGSAENCEELRHCPAPHAGFITKGDNDQTNRNYDQVTTLSAPVKPEWVIGTAELRVPYLGNIRLAFSGVVTAPIEPATAESDLPAVTGSIAPTPQPSAAGGQLAA